MILEGPALKDGGVWFLATPSVPSDADVVAIKALVVDMLRRAAR